MEGQSGHAHHWFSEQHRGLMVKGREVRVEEGVSRGQMGWGLEFWVYDVRFVELLRLLLSWMLLLQLLLLLEG